jgi:hypothetical protein
MSTELWDDTERAFAGYQNDVPIGTVKQRAQARSRRTRLASGLTAVVVVTTGGAVVLAGGGSSGVAYAGWTPVAQPADAATLAEVADACGARPELGSLHVLDRRGEMSVGSFGDGRICVVIEGRLAGVFGDISDLPLADTAAIAVDQVHRIEVLDAPSLEISAVTGSVDDMVDEVIIRRADGIDVEAVVSDGSFLAWWPRSQRPVTARAFAVGELRGTWTANGN